MLISPPLTRNNDVICLKETHGMDEFLQAVQVLVPQFRLFGTFTPNSVNAGGSAFFVRKKTSNLTVRLSLTQPLAKGVITL